MPDPDDCCKGCDTPPRDWWKSPTATHCDFVVDPGLRAAFHGRVWAEVREQNSQTTTTVIDVDDPWVVDVHLEVGGQLVGLFCGYWCISVCLESMCGDIHYRFPQDAPPPEYCCCLIDIDQDQTEYDAQICVPANKVRESECGAPYELTVIVTTLKEELRDPKRDRCDPNNHRPLGIATACELPLMTFYSNLGGPGE